MRRYTRLEKGCRYNAHHSKARKGLIKVGDTAAELSNAPVMRN